MSFAPFVHTINKGRMTVLYTICGKEAEKNSAEFVSALYIFFVHPVADAQFILYVVRLARLVPEFLSDV